MHGILFTTRKDSKRFCLKRSGFYQDSKKKQLEKRVWDFKVFCFDSSGILLRLQKKVQDSERSLKGFWKKNLIQILSGLRLSLPSIEPDSDIVKVIPYRGFQSSFLSELNETVKQICFIQIIWKKKRVSSFCVSTW